MRKTIFALSVAAALVSGQALADQATLNALQNAGIVLSADLAQAIAAAPAGDQALADAIAAAVAANPEQAAEITRVAVRANPNLAVAIVTAIIAVAPQLTDTVVPVAKAAAPEQAASIDAAVSAATDSGLGATNGNYQSSDSSIPNAGGSGNGGDEPPASPSAVE